MSTIFEIRTSSFKMTEKEFEEFCLENRDLRIEKDAYGTIYVMSPTYTETGEYNSIILLELGLWNRKTGSGHVFDSSTGYRLPNGAVRSPDVSWISNRSWDDLDEKKKTGFAQICPEFVIELRSETDNLTNLRAKMKEWMDNGCKLAWLINIHDQEVEIYKTDSEVRKVIGFTNILSGEHLLPGFTLDLNLLVS